ncbi:MAG TPA: family 1 encapsulin nanocompartment shell protein [Candidatus Limiplasma sp.]|nr:family 1 encapsulin nanocompartment shell protein [Candidatus Limiplasma sp.]HPS80692.1 family 1 encapsulin nanocompartment shell protein [Candidatus Limiplasma sp.]
MDFLARTTSPIAPALWEQIDAATVNVARNVLTGRRILHLNGPLGIGVASVQIDDADTRAENLEDGFIVNKGRRTVEIPTIYEDFTLLARDLAVSEASGYPTDLSAVLGAAQAAALKEDRLIFFGNANLGIDGLLTAPNANQVPKSDWSVGENAFTDVAAAIDALVNQGVFGAYTLVLSPNLHTQLQRLQPGTGLLEIDRVAKLVGGQLYKSPVLGKDQAVLLCAQPENMDLVVGQDLAAAYLEQRELNHHFRLIESVLPRIRKQKAIAVFR